MKKYQITFDEERYTVEVVTRKNMKNLRLRMITSDTVRISKGHRVSVEKALHFVQEKKEWICTCAKELDQYIHIELRDPYQITKSKLRLQVHPIIDNFCQLMGLPFPRIVIGKYSSQWGRCSSRNEIALNVVLQYLPTHLVEYVVLHEVCHLVHMNHSPSFWKLVERYMPDYRMRKKEMHKYLIR